MKNFLITLFQTFLFSFLFTSSFAQHSCSHKPGDHVRACGLQAIYEDMNTQVPPPADFVAGGPRDVVISVTYNGFASFPAAQAAFQYAVDIWASTLTSNVPITVDATFSNIGGGTLGFAYANGYWINFSGAEESDVYYPSALADKLAGFNIDPGSPDIVTEFNNGTNWYFGTDGNTPSGQFDFVTVVLHELGHGLGVAGFGAVNGGLGTVSSNGDPSIYDFYAEDGSGTPLTDYSQNSTSLAAQLTSNNLFWNGSLAVGNNGGMEPKLYAPSTWASGSSYSHVDEDSYPAGSGNSLMTPFVGQAESNHNPGPIIIGLMGDIGWDTTTDGGCPLNEATLSLTTDCYPGETSWMIEDEFGAILYSANAGSLPDLTTINTPLCLEEGCYTFTISDTFGDGLAGSLEDACGIDGDYELTDDLGNILVSMEAANFGSSISHDFCLSGSGGELFGCTDPAATNYDSAATIDDGSCDYDVLGCTDPSAINYNPDATVDDGSCVYDSDDCVINSINVYPNGCGENGIQNMQYTFDYSGDCIVQEICVVGVDAGNDFCADLSDNNFGSGDVSGWVNFPEAGDYDFYYTLSDGTVSPTGTLTLESCTPNEGCTNPYALNYDSTADIDDESCVYDDTICDCSGAVHTLGVLVWVGDGFADDSAYEWEGQLVDFDCIDWAFDCGDINGDNGADPYNVCDGSFPLNMPPNNGCVGDIFGCTDPDATNYNPDATVDDGSCVYDSDDCVINSINVYPNGCGENGIQNMQYTFDYSGDCIVQEICVVGVDAGNDFCADLSDNNFGSGDVSGWVNFPEAGDYDFYYTLSDGTVSPTGTLTLESCTPNEGCTNPYALNYDSTADIDDESCVYDDTICDCSGAVHTLGVLVWVGDGFADDSAYEWEGQLVDFDCIDWAFDCGDINGDNGADPYNVCDGSFPLNMPPNNGCVGDIFGCTDPDATNYNPDATVDDGSCDYEVLGCTDSSANNYNPDATIDDGSCDYDVMGCTLIDACNYDPLATINDGSCDYSCQGCTNPAACNYDADATVEDGSCDFTCLGCTDPSACNYDPTATIDNGSCDYNCLGCTLIDACNYDPGATIDDGSCDFTCYGCTDTEATNYDPGATIDDGSCIYGEIEGCTDSTACNFDQFANVEDGSCEYVSCMGCTDIEACNWDPTATMDDGSCDYDCYGCTDSEATNYDPDATIDDGSCIYGEIEGCTDSEACNYDDFATTDDGTCEYETCSGCTDSTALNYDDTATIDDGSCIYDCVYPTMIFSAFCEDGESTGFFVEMNIIDLGNGAPYAISNNQNSDVIQLSFNGVINLGPFDNGDQVVITVVSELYPDCLITSPLLTMNCDPDNVEEEAFAGAKIFPNPNSGEFTINVGDHQGSVTMDIYEITGKLITSEQFVVVEGENHHVSLHDDLAFGTYVLMLNSSAKNEQFRLVIK